MLAHLAALAGLLFPVIGNVLGTLAVRLAHPAAPDFVAAHVREALNFNLTVSIAAVACAVLALAFVGLLLGTVLFIAWLVLTLIAAIHASDGTRYRYPFAIRFVH